MEKGILYICILMFGEGCRIWGIGKGLVRQYDILTLYLVLHFSGVFIDFICLFLISDVS